MSTQPLDPEWDGTCPECGKTANWDRAARVYVCMRCGVTSAPQRRERLVHRREITSETYVTLRQGRKVKVERSYHCPLLPEDERPDLAFSEAVASVVRLELRAARDNERRWGRDHLRKQRERGEPYDLLNDAAWVVERAFGRK